MKIIMGDWLMNAGIIGYLRIQKNAGKKISIKDQTHIEINKKDLENFSHGYFTYALEQYMENQLSVYGILKKFKKLDPKYIWELNSKIKNESDKIHNEIKLDYNDFDSSIKTCIKKLSRFKDKAIGIIRIELKSSDVEQKDVVKLEEKIKNEFSDRIEKIKDGDTKFLVTFFKNFYFNKNIIGNYSIVRTNDRRTLFEREYVESAINQLDSNVSVRDGIICKFCRTNTVYIKDLDDDKSIFSEGMFSNIAVSANKFKNFFYNMQSDLFMCDVCELLFLCAWAGLNEIPYQARNKINGKEIDSNYIFVNIPSLELTYDENEKIDKQYKISLERLEGTIYEDVVKDVFLKQQRTKSSWAIQNILFVELKTVSRKDTGRPNYHYFHMGKDVAKLFQDNFAINSFKWIQGNEKLSDRNDLDIGREVVSRILRRDPLLPLCYQLIHTYLNEQSLPRLLGKAFNISLIFAIYSVILSGDKTMLESKQVFGILNHLRDEGSKFTSMDYEKRKSRSYVLLSMIRNKKIDAFYDMVVKMYMSENKSIPESLISILNHKDEINFQSRAYAFMSGFLQKNNKLQNEVETVYE
ncbi:MAG: type I-B CRISPR-associated protein Cas8b1/Cst1 [Nitrosotalea sp.]